MHGFILYSIFKRRNVCLHLDNIRTGCAICQLDQTADVCKGQRSVCQYCVRAVDICLAMAHLSWKCFF